MGPQADDNRWPPVQDEMPVSWLARSQVQPHPVRCRRRITAGQFQPEGM